MIKRVNKGNRRKAHVTIVAFDKNVGAYLQSDKGVIQ